ncbi:hypothetical protein AB0I82_00815 [Streptomyces sp. NPDC050315]|uniref:hypothetical protein n=1 Tax=Streptomyces sp. NPDC050315 TaxID=3155039 RepID=UPI00341B3AFC
MPRPLRLGLTLMPPVPHQSPATWKHPRNMCRGYRFDRKEVSQHLGRLPERARVRHGAHTPNAHRSPLQQRGPARTEDTPGATLRDHVLEF